MSSPRRTVLRGSVLAAGYWLSDGNERQLISLWKSGAEVRRLGAGYVLVLRSPERVNADLGAAAPLVRSGKWLLSAALQARELSVLSPNSNLVLVAGGELSDFELEQLPLVDPANLLDVSGFELRLPTSQRPVAAPSPALSDPADASALFDEQVGRSAEDKAQQEKLVQALSAMTRPDAKARPATGSALGRAALGLIARLLASVWRARGAPRPPTRGLPARAKLAAIAGVFSRLRLALARWLANTRIAAHLGRLHAKYLNELLDLLAQHDDEEVLRRAIPLGGKGTGEDAALLSLPPSPRLRFEISLGPRAAGPALGLVGGLYERLRRSYEAVFARLEAAGKHEQAAYFLAEILNESERAVAYLERHGKAHLAAQLAEARDLPAGLVVRQWFLAGDHERAVLIAVREGAFADAILRLENSGKKAEAAALRWLQAERLARAGLLVRAAELAHQLENGAPLALRWLQLARDAGELRGIPLELSLDGNRFEAARSALEPWFGGVSPDQLPALLRVAEGFERLDVEVAKPLARELVRELFAVAANLGDRRAVSTSVRVGKYVGGAFKADLPPLAEFEQRVDGSPRNHRYSAGDAGSVPVRDLHRFGGHVLLALGDAGVVALNRQGKRVAHFDLPAEALVASTDGSRVLCVATRGNRGGRRLEVGRIDLAQRRSERWCELEATSFARQFDGETWLVCTTGWPERPEGELLQLDVLDTRPRVLRRLPMPLDAPSIHLADRHVNVVGHEPFAHLERMRYELPQLTLRQRQVLVSSKAPDPESAATEVAGSFFLGTAAASGDAEAAVYDRWADDPLSHTPGQLVFGTKNVVLPATNLEGSVALELHADYYALSLSRDDRVRLLFGTRALPTPYLDLELAGTARSAQRLYDDLLLIGDAAGRVLGLDPRTGSVLFDWRT